MEKLASCPDLVAGTVSAYGRQVFLRCRDLHEALQNAAVAAGAGWARLSETA
jgi:hypothetical protein